MTLSLNDRALQLADQLADDAEAARVEVTTLSNGARVIDCGAQAAGGFEAGRCLAEVCMAGLGKVAYAPLVIEGRWLPALTVTTDRPARRSTAWSPLPAPPRHRRPAGRRAAVRGR